MMTQIELSHTTESEQIQGFSVSLSSDRMAVVVEDRESYHLSHSGCP